MKVDITLDTEEVEEAVRQYLEDAGYGVEDAKITFKVSQGSPASDPRGPSGSGR